MIISTEMDTYERAVLKFIREKGPVNIIQLSKAFSAEPIQRLKEIIWALEDRKLIKYGPKSGAIDTWITIESGLPLSAQLKGNC